MRRLIPMLVAALIALTLGSAGAAREHKKASPATALQGYCPVAYVVMNKAVKGDPKVSGVYAGHRYLFANAEAKKKFEAESASYQVAYEGWCATAVSMGKKLKSDPTLFTVHEGTTYLFSSVDAKKAFDGMPDSVIGKADAQWIKLTAKPGSAAKKDGA